ncbi:hypothetical protein [Mycobacterium sp. 23]
MAAISEKQVRELILEAEAAAQNDGPVVQDGAATAAQPPASDDAAANDAAAQPVADPAGGAVEANGAASDAIRSVAAVKGLASSAATA